MDTNTQNTQITIQFVNALKIFDLSADERMETTSELSKERSDFTEYKISHI